MESVDTYGDHVRVRYMDGPFPVMEDVIVERKVGGGWVRVVGFCSMSNDYAFTEARRVAKRTQVQMNALAASEQKGGA